MEACSDVLYTKHTFARLVSQSSPYSSVIVASIAIMVLLSLSTRPSPCKGGFRGVLGVLKHPPPKFYHAQTGKLEVAV